MKESSKEYELIQSYKDPLQFGDTIFDLLYMYADRRIDE
jgi:hypothetical protein